MKMIIKVAAAGLLLGAFNAGAETTLSFPSEIQPLILNTVDAEELLLEASNNTLQIQEGTNQLLFKVGQLVSEDAKHRKYNSPPFIIRFEAQEAPLTLSYPKIRTIAEAKAFERAPAFQLATADDQVVEFAIDTITAGGLQNLRDYQNELVAYNGQVSAIAGVNQTNTAEASPVSANIQGNEATGNPSSRMAILQSTFADMNTQEQQQFMQWAMRNLK